MENLENAIGKTAVPSTTQDVSMIVNNTSGLDSLKNQMVYFDVNTSDRSTGVSTTSRAFGFINEIRTENSLPGIPQMLRDTGSNVIASLRYDEYRSIGLKVASTFSKSDDDSWGGGAPLPTSPSLGTDVFAVDSELINGLFTPEQLSQFTYLGRLRGAGDISAPLALPYFGGKRGASSSCFVGKTGSGKTSFGTSLLINQMRHKDHAIITVDPQGQWNNENGFVYSPQKAARALGRQVYAIRVGEDIRLDLTEDNFIEMLSIVDAFSKVGRMAKENRDLLATEVGELIVRRGYRFLEKNHRELLTDIFLTIMKSSATLRRIYASEDRQEALAESLGELCDSEEFRLEKYYKENRFSYAGQFGNKNFNELSNEALERVKDDYSDLGLEANEEEKASIDDRWKKILSKFSPLLNLFMTKNISGGRRRPLGGSHGFLTEILQVRNENSAPAPYVILDMSPDVKNKIKSEMLGSAASAEMNMRKLLDNDSIKASILKIIFSELKEASEEAFANGGGNLNTQIVFDEAWRYAPNHSDDEVIMDLSKKLEGFALDTRKFGIGWTYILQSPTDLRDGIWKQLKYVYAGYGLVGADLKKLADLTDDPNVQLQTYKQFTPPDMSGEYPFMIMGSVSPLITAQIPLFLNAYITVEDFYEHNQAWMNQVAQAEGLPSITPNAISATVLHGAPKKNDEPTPTKEYSVGNHFEKHTPRKVEPQRVALDPPSGDLEVPPF